MNKNIVFRKVIVNYSLVESEVEEIRKENDITYLRTKYFEIDIEAAMKKGEIILNDIVEQKTQIKHKKLRELEEMDELADAFLIGEIEVNDILKNIISNYDHPYTDNERYLPRRVKGYMRFYPMRDRINYGKEAEM